MDLGQKDILAGSGSKAASFIWIFLTLTASAVEPLIVKIGYQGAASAYQLLVLKFLLGAVFIAPIYKYLRWIGSSGLLRVLGVSGLYVLTYVFMYGALTRISAVVLITVVTSTPALVALINAVKRNESTSLRFWAGFVLCFFGVALTIGLLETQTFSLDALGMGLAFGSVVTSALYRTQMDGLTKIYQPITVSGYLFLSNAVLALLFLPGMGEIPSRAWSVGVWIAIVGAVANIAFLSALHLIGSTRISIISVLQRPIAIVLAALLLNEPLTALQILGILFVLLGVQLAKVTPVAKTIQVRA